MTPISILSKRPWYKPLPESTLPHPAISSKVESINGYNCLAYTQQRMLEEYHPSSHDIYNKRLYPDILREIDEIVTTTNPDGSIHEVNQTKQYIEAVPRTAFAYQQYIETKRTDHLVGNDATFERNWVGEDKAKDDAYQQLVDGWEQYDMEDALYQIVHQSNIVADAAYVQYLYTDEFGKKQLGWNVYSYLKGDSIYPHCDPRTGIVYLFARQFTDDYGNALVEVWDTHDYYLFAQKQTQDQVSIAQVSIDQVSIDQADGNPTHHTFHPNFTLDGYYLIQKTPHGFPFCPVAYRRCDDGPVWVFSQDSIEAYEEDFNGLRHNNKAYGEPILVTKGDDVAGVPELDGTIKNIDMGKDDDASYLQAQSAADSYMKALDKLEELIYLQSFIVKTPELKSGDLPAAALKIIYSPAVEKAMHEVKEIQPVINRMFNIFRYGYGIINARTLDYDANNLPIKVYIKPFVHQSDSALVSDIVNSVNAGVLSHRTGSERLSSYISEENEYDRITAEQKQQQQADLLYEETLASATATAQSSSVSQFSPSSQDASAS